MAEVTVCVVGEDTMIVVFLMEFGWVELISSFCARNIAGGVCVCVWMCKHIGVDV